MTCIHLHRYINKDIPLLSFLFRLRQARMPGSLVQIPVLCKFCSILKMLLHISHVKCLLSRNCLEMVNSLSSWLHGQLRFVYIHTHTSDDGSMYAMFALYSLDLFCVKKQYYYINLFTNVIMFKIKHHVISYDKL